MPRVIGLPERNERWRTMYVDQQMTGAQIAKAEGVHPSTVLFHLKRMGVVRSRGEAGRLARSGFSFDDAEAARLYESGLSSNDITAILRCSKSTLFDALRKQGVVIRSRQEASRRHRNSKERRTPHPRDLRGQHKCAICGVTERLEVHHINGDPGDNVPENLMWMCWEHHIFVEWLVDKALTGIRRRTACRA